MGWQPAEHGPDPGSPEKPSRFLDRLGEDRLHAFPLRAETGVPVVLQKAGELPGKRAWIGEQELNEARRA